MDPATLIILVLALKILALTVPLALIGAGGWVLFKRSHFGRALVDRVADGANTQALVHALVDQVAHLEQELGELQERVDFAERRLIGPAPIRDGAAETGGVRTPPRPQAVG